MYMSEHPIEGLMTTAMNSIQDMIDVNTIIGEPIETSNNIVIIPISKVSFGFAAGGSEFQGETIDEYKKVEKEEAIQYRLPFGGGSGAGVSINPIAFLVITKENVRLIPVSHSSSIDRLLDYMPDLMEKVNSMMNRCIQNKKEQTEKIITKMTQKDKKPTPQEKQHINNDVAEHVDRVIKKVQKTKNEIPEEVTYEFEYDETKDEDDEI